MSEETDAMIKNNLNLVSTHCQNCDKVNSLNEVEHISQLNDNSIKLNLNCIKRLRKYGLVQDIVQFVSTTEEEKGFNGTYLFSMPTKTDERIKIDRQKGED